MYKIKTDTHVHSIFTNHAYSTIEENARYAGSTGIECIAITDHFGPIFLRNVQDGIFHLGNRVILPSEMYGVRVLKGIEIDIIDHKGNLAYYDMKLPMNENVSVHERLLPNCELVIASVHGWKEFRPSTVVEHTEMYINALRNPYVDILGHSGRAGMAYDIDEVLKVAKEEGKIIEINNHSFDLGPCDVCKTIAERCAELGVYITVSSDAHFSHAIGHYDHALSMLEKIHFPEELIANASMERLFSIVKINKQNI